MILEPFFEIIKKYFYSIVAGIAILLFGFAMGIIAKKFILRILKEIELNKIMSKIGITFDSERGISFLVSFLIYVITVIFFLNQLGITSIMLYLVLGAILMLIILTFLVGLKDVIPNMIAWAIIQKKGAIAEGRTVEVREIYGVVEKIGYLETEIRTENGDVLYVPNSLFLKSKFKLKKESN